VSAAVKQIGWSGVAIDMGSYQALETKDRNYSLAAKIKAVKAFSLGDGEKAVIKKVGFLQFDENGKFVRRTY
jgi:hypothetical protein